jgi:predicted DNA-binding transcriptional regulator AlpA
MRLATRNRKGETIECRTVETPCDCEAPAEAEVDMATDASQDHPVFADEKKAAPSRALANEVLLVPAEVAGPMCGRSEASWWRDHAAGRIPAPAWRSPGRTLWSVEEIRAWIAARCPVRKTWESLKAVNKGGKS